MIDAFAKAFGIGFTIAAAIGPIGMLLIQKTLKIGMKGALSVGFGAAIADGIYGAIAAFGLSVISNFLLELAIFIKLAGGFFLLYLAYKDFKTCSIPNTAKTKSENAWKLMFEVILLALTNPMTIIFFISIFSNTVGQEAVTISESLSMILGIFSGSVTFYLLFGAFLSKIKHKISEKWLIKIKHIASAIIGLFGTFAIVSGFIKLLLLMRS